MRRTLRALPLLLALLAPPPVDAQEGSAAPVAGQPAAATPSDAPDASTAAAAAASRPAAPQAARPGAAAPARPTSIAELEREERSWLDEHLPAPLLRRGPRGLRWWQWAALPLAALVSLGLGLLLGWTSGRLLRRLAARTATAWDDALVERLTRPVGLLWALLVASALRQVLQLDGRFDEVLGRSLGAVLLVVLCWGGFRAIDVAFRAIAEAPAAQANPGLRGLLPLLRKLLKAAALAIGLVAVLNELGFQVTSLIAGLGLGGLAVALAAQKTVENLIGSVAISLDRPFRVGDWVAVDGIQGTVEQVGVRSTRIRTADRTMVSMPNGRLADLRIESFAGRDRFRLAVTIGLTYQTSAAQVREVLRELEAALRAHPGSRAEAPQVNLVDLRESCLAVEVVAFLEAPDQPAFQKMRGELLLGFMEIVERAGAAFAFPTRTVHVASLPAGAVAAPRKPE